MSSSNESFKHESLQDCDSIIKYIDALSEGFSQGALLFMSDGKRVVLKPQGLIKLEIEAKRKDDQIKLALKFRWTEEEGSGNDLTMKPLVISSGEQE
ncbi:MAG: amphi-Trp domain-containing protein [Pseudomonadota bacterium]